MKWQVARFLLAASMLPLFAQDIPTQQVYKQADAIAASAGGVEDITRRTKDSRHFRKPNGSWTSVVGHDLNQDDGKGSLTPVFTDLWQTNGGGWVLHDGPVEIRVPKTNKGNDVQHVYTGPDGKQHTLTLSFPNLTYVRDMIFSFAAGNLIWNLELGTSRMEFSAVVAKAQGAQTYSFDFDMKGLSGTVNAAGDLIGDDGARISRAMMIRADRQIVPCSAWMIAKKTLSFNCDDSAFPKSAFPYTIDPTV